MKICSWSLIWLRGPLSWFKDSIALTFLSLLTIAYIREKVNKVHSFFFFTSSTAYRNETACLNTHVDNCVKDDPLLYILKDEIGKLLLLLLYHCGDLGFEVMDINQVILKQVKCDAADLNKMTTCWDDFRETFQRNKSDLSLCRWETCKGIANDEAQRCFFDLPQLFVSVGKRRDGPA